MKNITIDRSPAVLVPGIVDHVRRRILSGLRQSFRTALQGEAANLQPTGGLSRNTSGYPVSYPQLRAHETRQDHVCRLLLKKKTTNTENNTQQKDNNNKNVYETDSGLLCKERQPICNPRVACPGILLGTHPGQRDSRNHSNVPPSAHKEEAPRG